ncbi:hypothetical protein C7C46_18335 [Streptomyces tateyamensis]|uniref:Integral membrane protein n=1 Tax=Streptomyces tateyamensis TaxID=565073 RepID=A0A2V4P450_9ACTN|nr:hypothetical protein [Streptomyces tateyamensis]PYC77594.1 hypothetical protein C7C46_18335 [Streptomyces tateyamensis]
MDDSRPTEFRSELDAALQARKELGPEYETELVDSFLSRIDARLDARVEHRVAERLDAYESDRGGRGPRTRRERDGKRGWGAMPIVSLVFAIPLTAIGASHGLPGMLISWAGIVGVNLAAVGAEQREQQRQAANARRSEWA